MQPYPWSLGFNNSKKLHPYAKVLLIECNAQHRHGRNHPGTFHFEFLEVADVHQAEIRRFGFVLAWRIVSAPHRYRRTLADFYSVCVLSGIRLRFLLALDLADFTCMWSISTARNVLDTKDIHR